MGWRTLHVAALFSTRRSGRLLLLSRARTPRRGHSGRRRRPVKRFLLASDRSVVSSLVARRRSSRGDKCQEIRLRAFVVFAAHHAQNLLWCFRR